MSRVILLVHDGVSCALPASQVAGATSSRDTGPALALFRRDGRGASSGTRMIRVHTALGDREISCSSARFDTLSEESMLPLPDVLRDALSLPHLVGVAASEPDAMVWLVDLMRLSFPAQTLEQ
jgi:hypothetical protein